MVAWFTYIVKWLPQYFQLTSTFSYTYNKKKEKKKGKNVLIVVRGLRIYSLNNLPVYHIALLAIIIVLYFPFLVVLQLKVCTFWPPSYNSPSPHLLPLETKSLISFFSVICFLFVCFKIPHVDHTVFLPLYDLFYLP